MTMLDGWEFARLKAHLDAVMVEAEENLHGTLALEPNDPQRETQVNHWNEEQRRTRALLAKLDRLTQAESDGTV